MIKDSLVRLAVAGALLFTAGSVLAQHDMGGGSAAGPPEKSLFLHFAGERIHLRLLFSVARKT